MPINRDTHMNYPQILSGKRILFVFCSLELGGAERQGLHLARHLKSLGCDVRVWSNHAGPGLVIDHCNEAGIPWAVHRFRWPCRKSSLVRDGLRMVWALRQERPDVILAYTTWPNVGCGLTWRLSPAKVCIWGQRNVNDLQGHPVERLAYRRVSAVICNAEHQVDYLRQTLDETPAPVFVVHNGVDLAPCRKTRAEWRTELGIDENATVATMVANFRPQKDHPTLLYAWRKVLAAISQGRPRPRLLLAGAPQQSYDAVHQLATNLGLLDSVSFLGQVQDISGLLAASDIGILTSTHEGLSNVVIEYMASGLPVVATDLPGNHETLGDNPQQPFCKPGDPDSLATQLQLLLHNPELRQELGACNRQRASAEFPIDKMCETTVGIICDLLDAVFTRTRNDGKAQARNKQNEGKVTDTESHNEKDHLTFGSYHPRILVNSMMWQSKEWKDATINVFSEEEVSGKKPAPSAFATAWRLFRQRSQADIVSPSGQDVAMIYGLLCRLSLFKGPRQVLREILLVDPNPHSLRWRRRLLLRRIASKWVDAVVVNSQWERRIYSTQFALPEERFHFVPFHTNNLDPHHEPPGLAGLAAGRSGRDYKTFFEAIREVDYPFIVVSNNATVAPYNLPDNVKHYREIPRSEYIKLLRQASFMIVPLNDLHRSTGQVVILDAYAIGRPVVATRTVGTVDYVTEGETGLFCEPKSVDSLRTQIIRMINDKEARERMGQQALARVIRDHTFEVHVRQMLKVILSVVSGVDPTLIRNASVSDGCPTCDMKQPHSLKRALRH